MAEYLSFELDTSGSFFSVPKAVLPFLNEADEPRLRVLLALLSGAAGDEKQAAALLLLPTDLVQTCIDFWIDKGVFELSGRTVRPTQRSAAQNRPLKPKREAAPPQYSMEEISFAASQNQSLASLLQLTQQRLNKTLNQSETRLLYSFCEYYGLEPAAVMVLIEYMASLGKTSLRQIEKTVIHLDECGIKTLEETGDYIEKRRERDSFDGAVRRLFGLGARAYTAREKKEVSQWQEEFGCSVELLVLAYEKTVDATSAPSIHYAHKILSRWHEEGKKTPEQVQQESRPQGSRKGQQVESSIDMDDYEKWAWKESRRIIGG